MFNEKTPLLNQIKNEANARSWSRATPLESVANAVFRACRIIISTVLAPGRYIIACFYNEQGQFSVFGPVYKVGSSVARRNRQSTNQQPVLRPEKRHDGAFGRRRAAERTSTRPIGGFSSANVVPTARDADTPGSDRRASLSSEDDSPSRHTRSKSVPASSAEASDEATPTKSIRIKLVNEDVLRQRRQRRHQRGSLSTNPATATPEPPLTPATVKSPTSPTASLNLTKYPQAPAPPRPLVPRRQPSHTFSNPPSARWPQKTLIIDLDETLIHSMAKGGRMSTGHMVEVKLNMPIGADGATAGPGVPILYYVHKRPHCDEFLRKVSKWYNLIVFTASVQEYADPVIDWLELERKYFSGRYYRQHCTYRNGAYIKDLSTVEADLSKVMILDNSPMSYIINEDNAIPIEGWISDPTDNDLIHLIPLLEGLQYATDVRALLALRLGEAKHSAVS